MGGHRRFLRAVRRHVRVGWRGGRSARKLTCHTGAPAQQDHSKQLRAGRAAGLLPHARSYCDGLSARGSVPMEPAAQRAEVPPPATGLSPAAACRLSPAAACRLPSAVARHRLLAGLWARQLGFITCCRRRACGLERLLVTCELQPLEPRYFLTRTCPLCAIALPRARRPLCWCPVGARRGGSGV